MVKGLVKQQKPAGANEYQIEESKKATATMNAILGDPDRLLKLAEDFVRHYENRVNEGATVKGKAMFVCSSREIGYEFYKNVIALRPEWAEIRIAEEGAVLTDKDRREIKPMERIKMIMARGKDDPKEMYDLPGNETQSEQDLFSKDYLAKIDKIKLSHTKIKLLQQLLAKAIGEIKKVNKVKGIDFEEKAFYDIM